MSVLFYASGAVALISALLVITRVSAARAVVFLVLTFLATASVFYTLGAPFVAVLQVLIYAGAIIVLFVFVVMILNLGSEAQTEERSWLTWPVWVVPIILAAALIVQFVFAVSSPTSATVNVQHLPINGTASHDGQVSAQAVGRSLFTTYIIGVELASMMLLAGLVAAFHLGRRRGAKQK
jgi:NADH-quinone oxidoreductase subunit J